METTIRGGYKPSKYLKAYNSESTPYSQRFIKTKRFDVVYPAAPHKPTSVERHDAPFYQESATSANGVVYHSRPAGDSNLLPFRGLLSNVDRLALSIPFRE